MSEDVVDGGSYIASAAPSSRSRSSFVSTSQGGVARGVGACSSGAPDTSPGAAFEEAPALDPSLGRSRAGAAAASVRPRRSNLRVPAALAALCVSSMGLAFGVASALAKNGEIELRSIQPLSASAPTVGGESAEVKERTKVGQGCATLKAQITPNGRETTYQFEYGETVLYGSRVPASPVSIGSGEAPVPVEVEACGLKAGTTYHYRVSAHNEYGTSDGSDQTFATVPAALIDNESVSEVTSTSAILESEVDPLGSDTTLEFQYGTVECGTGKCGEVAVGGGSSENDQIRTVQLGGLTPSTIYHYRVVATNAQGSAVGPEQAFTTQPIGSAFMLPDDRAWELVTPPNKHGAPLSGLREGGAAIQASEEGTRFSDLTWSPLSEEEAAGNTNGVQFLSEREQAGGWFTQEIAAPYQKPVPASIGAGSEYRMFSSNLLYGAIQPFGETPLNPEVEVPLNPHERQETTYLRNDATGVYEPLVSRQNMASAANFATAEFVGANPSMTSVVFYSGESLTGEGGGLFDWMNGHLTLLGSGELGSDDDYMDAISTDGTHVIWSTRRESGEINETDVVTKERTPITIGEYEAASADGSRVFVIGGGELVEYALTSGKLTDVVTPLNPGEEPGVLSVLGASEDGSYVYFVATGALAEGATAGEYNLYVAHDGDAGWEASWIAALSPEDVNDWSRYSLTNRTSRVSPNGLYVAFMSDRALTGYDNRDAVSGRPDEEVFLYSASTKHLTCASCNPTGARPHGLEVKSSNFEPSMIDSQDIESNRWLAAALPGWTSYDLSDADYQSRYLSSSGRLFFDAVDSLVPQDTNGKADVYEYEPEGVGSCEKADGCVALISSGTSNEESAFLDASGNGNDVFFLTLAKLVPEDTDTAMDVYDAHVCTEIEPCKPVQLSPPACTTAEACRSAETPQPAIFGPPPSQTFSGAGNITPEPSLKTEGATTPTRAQQLASALKACKKKTKRKRASCERQARRRYGAAQSRKAAANKKGRR